MTMPATPAIPGPPAQGAGTVGAPEDQFALLLGDLLWNVDESGLPATSAVVPPQKDGQVQTVGLNVATAGLADVPGDESAQGPHKRPEDLLAPTDAPLVLRIEVPAPVAPAPVTSLAASGAELSPQAVLPPPPAPPPQPDSGIHLRLRTPEAPLSPATETGMPMQEAPVQTAATAVEPTPQPAPTPAAEITPAPEAKTLRSSSERGSVRPESKAEIGPDSRPQEAAEPADAVAAAPTGAPAHKHAFHEENSGRSPDKRSHQEDAPVVTAQRSAPIEPNLRANAPEPRTHEASLARREAVPAEAAAPAREVVPPEPLQRPPLRAVSLDFSPDGSGDVRLKLAERAGEVHVSLHASDSRLTHQLREGIHDLASVLASAGYEAETSSGRQFQPGQQHREQPQQRYTPPQQKSRAGDFEQHLADDKGSLQ